MQRTLKAGDRIKVGTLTLTIVGILQGRPARVSVKVEAKGMIAVWKKRKAG